MKGVVSYRQAIIRPFTNWKYLAVGFLLSVVPIVKWFASGYQLRCANNAMDGDYKLPDWSSPAKLFFIGFLQKAVYFIYSIPLLVTALYFILSIAQSYSQGGLSGFIEASSQLSAGIFAAAVLFILTLYIAPAAVLNFVEKNRFSAAFNFLEIGRRIIRKQWIFGWLASAGYAGLFLGAVYLMIYAVIAPLANLQIPIIVVLTMIFELGVFFIAGVTIWSILGEAYAETNY